MRSDFSLNNNLLTGFLPSSAAASIYLYKNRHTPSGQSRVYWVTQLRTDDGVHCLPRVRRHRASKPQGILPDECCLACQVTMDQLICASLSDTHYYYWYEVVIACYSMLKVPAGSAKKKKGLRKGAESVLKPPLLAWRGAIVEQGSKRQAERTGFLAQYLSGLRHTDAPHTWT